MKRIKIILTIVLTIVLTVVLAQPSFAGNFTNTNLSAYTDSDYLYGEYSDFTVNNYIESYVCARYNTQSPNDSNAYLGIDYFFNYYDDLCNYKLWASKIRYDKTDSYGNYVYEITGDDPIVNIIPKNLFTTENTTAYLGNEYGFYINTTKINHCNNGFFYSGAHYGENHEMMVSKVFLYDIKNDRSNLTSENISFIPLAAFEFVCIKSNSYYCDHSLCEYYSKTNNIVMPSCFRMRENQIGYLDYKFSNVCYSAEILGNSELDENGLYENDSNVPFITTVSGTHTFSTAIEKTEETTVTFGDIYRLARLCRDYVLMFTGDVAALVRVVIKNGVYMYNEFKKIDCKCESNLFVDEKVVCFEADFENVYNLQLERYQLPIRNIAAIDSFTSKNYISCNTSYKVDFIKNSYTTNDQCLNYKVELNNPNENESFVLKKSLNYDLYDEDGNKIDLTPTNNIIEKNIYNQENVSTSFSQNIFGGAGYEVDYSFYVNTSGTYNIEVSSNMDIIALYTENQICVNIDGSKNYNGTNKTKIKYIGYKNNKTAAAYLSANTRYKIKYKGTNELGSLSIRLDTQFPHKLKFNSLTENQEYIVNPSETGMYYLYTESNLDTKIYLYKKENSGYKLLEYVDDIEIDDDNVEYNASLYYEFEKGNEYKIVVTANNQNESANFYIDFYMASTKVFGNVTVNCKSGETYEYYYEASANRIVNAYTEGNVDTALTVYIGQVQIAYNDDSEIDDEIEYNASVYFIAEKNSTYKIVLYAYDDGLANLYIS